MKHKLRLVLVLLTACCGSVFGQQVFFSNGAAPRNSGKSQKAAFERQLSVLIGDMKRTCELSEVQVRKLKLAAKGAVASAMEKFEKRQRRQRQALARAGVNLPRLLEPEEEEEAPEDEDEEQEADGPNLAIEMQNGVAEIVIAAPNAINLVAGQPVRSGSSSSAITNEPRWKVAVKNVVSAEQRQKYATVVNQRKAYARKANVSSFIAKVDHVLLLSTEQRSKLTTLVDDEFGAKFAAQVTSRNSFWTAFGSPAKATPPLSHEELKSFLDDAQFTEWKQRFEQELNQLKQRNAAVGLNGFAPVAAPAAVPAIRIEPNRNADNEDK
jgi:hypothetical protein